MRGTRHSEEQIIGILKQAEKGVATADLCRQTFHQRADAVPLEGEIQRAGQRGCQKAKANGRRNRKPKHIAAELTLDNRA